MDGCIGRLPVLPFLLLRHVVSFISYHITSDTRQTPSGPRPTPPSNPADIPDTPATGAAAQAARAPRSATRTRRTASATTCAAGSTTRLGARGASSLFFFFSFKSPCLTTIATPIAARRIVRPWTIRCWVLRAGVGARIRVWRLSGRRRGRCVRRD